MKYLFEDFFDELDDETMEQSSVFDEDESYKVKHLKVLEELTLSEHIFTIELNVDDIFDYLIEHKSKIHYDLDLYKYRQLNSKEAINDFLKTYSVDMYELFYKILRVFNHQKLFEVSHYSSYIVKDSYTRKSFNKIHITQYTKDVDARTIVDNICNPYQAEEDMNYVYEFGFNVHFNKLPMDVDIKKLYDIFDKIRMPLKKCAFECYDSGIDSILLPDLSYNRSAAGRLDYNQIKWFVYDMQRDADYLRNNIPFNANMSCKGPVKLSSISEKKLKDFKPGDFLFVDASDNLVSQDTDDSGRKNKLIAINVSEGTFASIKYLNVLTPDSGTYKLGEYLKEPPYQIVYGLDNTVIMQRYLKKKSSVTGYEVNDYILKMISKKCGEPNWNTSSLGAVRFGPQISGTYHSPLFISAWRFHTAGTERGNWYIPTMKELESFVSLINDIDIESFKDYLPEDVIKDLKIYYINHRNNGKYIYPSCEDKSMKKFAGMNVYSEECLQIKSNGREPYMLIPVPFIKLIE